MDNNRQLSSSYVVADSATGEVISLQERKINIPSKISFPAGFRKMYDSCLEEMLDHEIGKFFKLAYYIDYHTNQLVDQHVGRAQKRLIKKDIAIILDIGKRQTSTFMKKMKSIKAIMKIDGDYFINPRFASRSVGIDSDIIIKMIKIDSIIKKEMPKAQWNRLKHFIYV